MLHGGKATGIKLLIILYTSQAEMQRSDYNKKQNEEITIWATSELFSKIKNLINPNRNSFF